MSELDNSEHADLSEKALEEGIESLMTHGINPSLFFPNYKLVPLCNRNDDCFYTMKGLEEEYRKKLLDIRGKEVIVKILRRKGIVK